MALALAPEGGQSMPVQWGLCRNPSAICNALHARSVGPAAACDLPASLRARMLRLCMLRPVGGVKLGTDPTVPTLPEIVQLEPPGPVYFSHRGHA